jgi:hypothetical protein
MTVKLHSWTPSLLQDSTSLPGIFDFDCGIRTENTCVETPGAAFYVLSGQAEIAGGSCLKGD